MFKRFHDADKWEKSWFRHLTPIERNAWDFITSRCDNVGVWTPDYETAELFLGEEIDWDMFRERTNGNIELLENGKWWLVDFCSFQYAELEEDTISPSLLSYVKLLKKHGLWERYKKGINTLQDKDKDKDIDKDKEKDILILGDFENVKLKQTDYDTLGADYGEAKRAEIIAKLSAYKKSKGKTYKSDMGAIRQWVIEAVKAVKLSERPTVPGRPDGWNAEHAREHMRAIEEAEPPTDAELAEVEAMKQAALGSKPGALLVAALGKPPQNSP